MSEDERLVRADSFALAAVEFAQLEGDRARVWQATIREAALRNRLDEIDWRSLLGDPLPLPQESTGLGRSDHSSESPRHT